MITRYGLIGLSLVLATGACAPAEMRPEDRKPQLVKLGMTPRQVERLVGASYETCWEYDRGAGKEERACFRDGMANVHSKSERKPGSNDLYIDGWVAGEWPPRNPAPASASKVSMGQPMVGVARLLGKPHVVVESYEVGSGYQGTYVDSKLTSFDPIPLPMVH